MEESAAGLDDGCIVRNGQTRQLLEETRCRLQPVLRVDICNDKRILAEGIDELLARLDEFTGPHQYGLEQVYDRIDALEKFVGVVRERVDAMEEKVTEAENAFGGSSSTSKVLSSLPSPLFAKKPAPQYKKQLRYEEPDIFRCSDYLSTVSADDRYRRACQISLSIPLRVTAALKMTDTTESSRLATRTNFARHGMRSCHTTQKPCCVQ
ncbi:hypothetical protein HPB49_012939 [Dermacentor silvarum]|uniref:Uncharacterized protein n=1 Tax=Dermacentor silvarum TaxID=543639 RepID=A0ACB8DDG8_DERSI|nr:hypothetical protein HPB49_012939 [Dermacentor silvarum]